MRGGHAWEVVGRTEVLGRGGLSGPGIAKHKGLPDAEPLLAKRVAARGRLSDTGGLSGAEDFLARKLRRNLPAAA